MTPYTKAMAEFLAYADLPGEKVPGTLHRLQDLQLTLARWQHTNFGAVSPTQMTLGINEEVSEALGAMLPVAVASGRIAHISLKSEQKIRGYEDEEKCRREIADAIADITIFAMQLCTTYRLDFATLLMETASQVLDRDWKGNSETG